MNVITFSWNVTSFKFWIDFVWKIKENKSFLVKELAYSNIKIIIFFVNSDQWKKWTEKYKLRSLKEYNNL